MAKSKVHVYDSDHYPAVRFLNIEIGRAKACMGIGDERYIITGKMTLNYTNSEKWGQEVHIQVFSKDHKVEKRSGSHNWTRVEIFFPFKDLDILITALSNLRINFPVQHGPEAAGRAPTARKAKPAGEW